MQPKHATQGHFADVRRLGLLRHLEQARRYTANFQKHGCTHVKQLKVNPAVLMHKCVCHYQDAGGRNRWRVRIRQGLATGGDNEFFSEDAGNDFTAGFSEPHADSLDQPGMPSRTGERLSAQLLGGSLLHRQVTGHAAAGRSGDDSTSTAQQEHPSDGWTEEAAAGQEESGAAASWDDWGEAGPEEDQPEDPPEDAGEDTHMVKMYKEIEQRSKDAEAQRAAADSGAGLQQVPADHPVALRLADLAARIETDSTGWTGDDVDGITESGARIACLDSHGKHGALPAASSIDLMRSGPRNLPARAACQPLWQ